MNVGPSRKSLEAHPIVWSAMFVAAVGGAVRLALLDGVPLMVTNDGVSYTHTAWCLATGQGWAQSLGGLPSYRTPGYSVMLAGIFATFGRDPVAVVVIQRLLGLCAATAVAAVAAAIVKQRRSNRLALLAGVGCGLVPALDPRVLAMESYLLSETLSVVLVVALLVLPMAARRFRAWHLVWIGALGGLLCLVRPVFQVAIPFVLVGMVLLPGGAGWRPRLLALLAGCVAFAGTVLPWLAFNNRRGISGFGEGGAAVLWLGLGMSGRLDPTLAPSEHLAQDYARLVGETPTTENLHVYIFSIGTFEDEQIRKDIGRWAWRSVAADPASYAQGVLIAMLWQCDYLPGGTRPPERELIWMVRRASVGGGNGQGPAANMIIGGEPDAVLRPLATDRKSRRASWIFNAWGHSHHFGFVTLFLLVSAVAAGMLALVRRRWTLALLIAAGGAAFAVHAALLSPYARYSLPIWMAWSITPAVLVALGRGVRTGD